MTSPPCLVAALMTETLGHDVYNVGGTTVSFGEIGEIVRALVPKRLR